VIRRKRTINVVDLFSCVGGHALGLMSDMQFEVTDFVEIGNWSRNPRSGMRPLPSIILANEDQLIWLEVSERFARGGNRYNLAVWVRADDRKDAATMLDNVRHHVSAVIQAQTGEWAYFCHGSVARGLWEMSF